MTPPRSRATRTGTTWDVVVLTPLTLIHGSEGLFADRAVTNLRSQALAADPHIEIVTVDAATYTEGDLLNVTSPSLFDEAKFVLIENLESLNDAMVDDLGSYVAAPLPEDIIVVVVHRGGVRGKKTLDALRAAGATEVICEPLKREADKVAFVSAEFKRGQRRAEPAAVQALVEALGSDLRELSAACTQLMTDTQGAITVQHVTTYHGGRVEATGFAVADAAVAGQVEQAIIALRHALATGTDPVPIVAALALKLRTLAKVGALRSNRDLTPQDVGLVPWQVDKARRELQNWTPATLGMAIEAVARADAEVKGLSRDPQFAVERAVLTVATANRH